MRVSLVALAVMLGMVLVGCGGDQEAEQATPSVSAETAQTLRTPVPQASTPDATSAPEAPSTNDAEAEPLLLAARAVCEAGAAYGQALSDFIASGPQPSVASNLDPLRAALAGAGGRPRAEQMEEAVADYTKANEGLTVLFTEGETAYQPVKASGLDADAL